MSDAEDFDIREADADEEHDANDPEEGVESPKASQHKKHRRRDEDEEDEDEEEEDEDEDEEDEEEDEDEGMARGMKRRKVRNEPQ